jgi:hypothetical protein
MLVSAAKLFSDLHVNGRRAIMSGWQLEGWRRLVSPECGCGSCPPPPSFLPRARKRAVLREQLPQGGAAITARADARSAHPVRSLDALLSAVGKRKVQLLLLVCILAGLTVGHLVRMNPAPS